MLLVNVTSGHREPLAKVLHPADSAPENPSLQRHFVTGEGYRIQTTFMLLRRDLYSLSSLSWTLPSDRKVSG